MKLHSFQPRAHTVTPCFHFKYSYITIFSHLLVQEQKGKWKEKKIGEGEITFLQVTYRHRNTTLPFPVLQNRYLTVKIEGFMKRIIV